MIQLLTVNASDTINAGRIKFSANNQNVADAITASEDQFNTHLSQGHPALYYTKAEVDSAFNNYVNNSRKLRYYFGFNTYQNKILYCGVENSFPKIPVNGSITNIIVSENFGKGKITTAPPNIYPIAQSNILSLVADEAIIGGDEVVPLRAGMLLNISGANNYQIVIFTAPNFSFSGFGMFSITVEITPNVL